jgi:uncharacterized protein with PQ loop repeat
MISVQTALKIFNDKSVSSFSLLPFISLFTNCVIWTFYGVLKGDPTILFPNVVGMMVGFGCVVVYQSMSSVKNNSLVWMSVLIISVALFVASTGSWYNLGLIGCILAIVLMGSPLITLHAVVKEKSTASLPVLTSFANLGNSLSWSLYGVLVASDPMVSTVIQFLFQVNHLCSYLLLQVYVPNIIGVILSLLQVMLYFIYGWPPQPKDNNQRYGEYEMLHSLSRPVSVSGNTYNL